MLVVKKDNKMPNKSPENYDWVTYLWILIISLWGGTAHTIRKLRSGVIKHFSISEWIGDMVIAGFLGVMTFYICEYANIETPINAVLIGIASHQGTKGIIAMEKYISKKLGFSID